MPSQFRHNILANRVVCYPCSPHREDNKPSDQPGYKQWRQHERGKPKVFEVLSHKSSWFLMVSVDCVTCLGKPTSVSVGYAAKKRKY